LPYIFTYFSVAAVSDFVLRPIGTIWSLIRNDMYRTRQAERWRVCRGVNAGES